MLNKLHKSRQKCVGKENYMIKVNWQRSFLTNVANNIIIGEID